MIATHITVDFPDDLGQAAFDRNMFNQMMQVFRNWGISRVYWMDYMNCEMFARYGRLTKHVRDTIDSVGTILGTAVEAAHQEGLEIFSVIKPFEGAIPLGAGAGTPAGRLPRNPKINPLSQTELKCMDFIRRRPELRMKRRRAAASPAASKERIAKIVFYASEPHIPLIDESTFHIYVSAANNGYSRYTAPYSFSYRQAFDELVSKEVMTLQIDGLAIDEPYILFTCETLWSGFKNRYYALARVYNEQGKLIPSTPGIVMPPARHLGEASVLFNFVPGTPSACSKWRQMEVLNEDLPLCGAKGFFALALGHDPYMTGALCPAEPEARQIWLDWTRSCLDAGVDGIDYRTQQHNSPFNYSDYGFNDVVVEEYAGRYGVNILKDHVDPDKKAAILGEAYTEFLRAASRLVRSRGKQIMHHLNIDMFREPHERHFLDIEWEWKKWFDEGLLDGVTLKNVAPGAEDRTRAVGGEMARERGIPFYYCPWHSNAKSMPVCYEFIRDQLARARADKDAAGFNLYESAALLDITPGSVRPYFEELGEYLGTGTTS